MHDILSQNRSPCSLYDIEITVRSPYPIVRAAAEKFHLPVPKISILNTPLDNAAATGISHGRSSISITAGALDTTLQDQPTSPLRPKIRHAHTRERPPPLLFTHHIFTPAPHPSATPPLPLGFL